MNIEGALGDLASSATEAGSYEIAWTCSIHITHSDDADDVPGGCDIAFFYFYGVSAILPN
jgi:hypothetical protein